MCDINVIKRDGRVIPFDKSKITIAIRKANANVKKESMIPDNMIKVISDRIEMDIFNSSADKIITHSVEDIQDMVENKLVESGNYQVAKEYILYRYKRNIERDKETDLMNAVKKKVNGSDISNSNANVDEKSFSGREKEASSIVGKRIALDDSLSKEVSNAHREMLIYQHDLEKTSYGIPNCLNINMQHVYEGFKTRNGDVRQPGCYETAAQQLAVAMQCQSQVQFGGVGTIHLDYDLAPYVKKTFIKNFKNAIRYIYIPKMTSIDTENKDREHILDEFINNLIENNDICIDNEELKKNFPDEYRYAYDITYHNCLQATEALYHNLNTLESRQGSQVPFTSINLGRDTSTEGRLVTEWVMKASLNGIGEHHTTSIFPISIFQYKRGVNAEEGDPNYDLKQLALLSMSKRIYPNWCNCNWSQAHEDENNIDTYFSTMGCRTLVGYDRHGLGYIRQGRGNNVPNTIILPKLGIEYGICLGKRKEPDLEGFWKAFENTLKITEKGLLERFKIMATQSPEAAPFTYQNKTMQHAEDCVDNVYEALKHNTLAIGYIGIAEMCQALFGKNHVHDKDIHAFALSVVKRINEFAQEASDRNDLNFSCYATPAEGLCRTALESLRDQYGIIENVTSREYLTNSHHVPVWEEVSIHDKLQIEAPFCKYPTGGCITYIEVDSMFVQNLKAVEDVIRYAFDVLDIPYLAFNFPIDTCLQCGYQGEFNDACPECGSTTISQLRRVTGYLNQDMRNFNAGKLAETKERVKHINYRDKIK